jgi:hypothetical protein
VRREFRRRDVPPRGNGHAEVVEDLGRDEACAREDDRDSATGELLSEGVLWNFRRVRPAGGAPKQTRE